MTQNGRTKPRAASSLSSYPPCLPTFFSKSSVCNTHTHTHTHTHTDIHLHPPPPNARPNAVGTAECTARRVLLLRVPWRGALLFFLRRGIR